MPDVKRRSGPTGAIPVDTYDEFHEFVRSYVDGEYSLLILLGSPGVGKSQAIRNAIGNRRNCFLETHVTAFALYRELYLYRDEPVIIDDIDQIYSKPGCVRILKALCNTDGTKTLRWTSGHQEIGDGSDQIPGSFTTNSPVCLIANEWRTLNENVRALEDRAIVVKFEPDAAEVHRRVGEWFSNDEVYGFIEQNLHLIARPSGRYYVKAEQLLRANPNRWRDRILSVMGVDDRTRELMLLLEDRAYKSEEERAAAFEAGGHGSRATYFRLKGKLKGARAVAPHGSLNGAERNL